MNARRLGFVFGGTVLLAAIAAALLFWRHEHALRSEVQRRRIALDPGPEVFVAEARLSGDERELTLPGDVRAFLQATVYAKVSGYVKSILVDKGDAVKKGQLLAELESPELDQQVRAAEADLAIKRRTFERYRQLVARDFVTRQDFDTARAQYGISQAALEQVRALQQYERLEAPFAGTVTARYVDPGALVPAATGSTQSALPLVEVADLRRLRMTVFVQQDAAPFIEVGNPVEIRVPQQPSLKIQAAVTRFAEALDPRSRTMLCEIWVDNPHRLFPGTFVQVTFKLRAVPLPIVPSSALLLHDDQPAVAVIRESRVHFVQVRPGLDNGKTVQILEGLQPGERVALSIPAEISDGTRVQPVDRKAEQGTEQRAVGGGAPEQQGGFDGASGQPGRPDGGDGGDARDGGARRQ